MTQACPDLGRARSHEIASPVVGWSPTQERHVSVRVLLPTPGWSSVPAVSDIGRMPVWAGQAWPPVTICFPHQDPVTPGKVHVPTGATHSVIAPGVSGCRYSRAS